MACFIPLTHILLVVYNADFNTIIGRSLLPASPLVHQRAYKAHYARMMKKKMTKPEFLQWSDMALDLRAQALKGEISFEEYEAELKK